MIEAEPKTAPIEIEGPGGLALRQFVPQDAETIFGLIDYDRDHLNKHYQWIADKYPTVEAVRQSIEKPHNPDRLRFGIWNGEIMAGSINLEPDPTAAMPTAEIGYWLGRQYIGYGYARQAVQALSRYAFENMGLDRLVAEVVTGNKASDATLLKAGFRLESLSWKTDYKTKYRLRIAHYELLKDKPKIALPVKVDM